MILKLSCLFPSGRKYRLSKGFTLIEALVVSGIIITMLALVLPDFRMGERQFALRRSASKLVQDLRRAQGLSMSAASSYCPEGQRLNGYGLILESSAPNNTFYKLFAKCVNGVNVYSEKEKIILEKKVKIKELRRDGSLVSTLLIFFYPPDPQTDLGGGASEARITLTSFESDLTVKVNKAGLINVE
ncbi:MAG: hypothetical protein Q7S70_01040 [bacterium]|nr:hypothetical protein [bacterium]